MQDREVGSECSRFSSCQEISVSLPFLFRDPVFHVEGVASKHDADFS